jgi:hypothetical protein
MPKDINKEFQETAKLIDSSNKLIQKILAQRGEKPSIYSSIALNNGYIFIGLSYSDYTAINAGLIEAINYKKNPDVRKAFYDRFKYNLLEIVAIGETDKIDAIQLRKVIPHVYVGASHSESLTAHNTDKFRFKCFDIHIAEEDRYSHFTPKQSWLCMLHRASKPKYGLIIKPTIHEDRPE